MGRVLLDYNTSLTVVFLFWYMGRTLSFSNDDWPAVGWNLRRVPGKWGKVAKILGWEGEYRRTTGMFNVAVVQMVLLFGSETWVLTPHLEKSLEGFHQWAARRMTGMGT